MTIIRTARSKATRATLTLVALAGALALAACNTPAPPPPPAAPPPPPPPPAVSLSGVVLRHAAAYAAYMEKAGAMSADFKSGADVAESLRFGDSYDPQLLLRGAIAYGAIAALQDPTFVAGVRTYAGDPASRQQMAEALLRDPSYVIGIKGSDSAAGLVMGALMAQGKKLVDNGGVVKQSAYAIQHQAWSKEVVANREQRLNDAKAVSASSLISSTEDVDRLQRAATGAAPLAIAGTPTPPPYTPVVVRGMAVAALAVLGQAGDEKIELMEPLFAESSSAACLNMAKLNLYQCLAVAKPWYEDMFCLGLHAMADTGQCIAKAAGDPTLALQQPAPGVAPTGAPGASVALHGKPPGER